MSGKLTDLDEEDHQQVDQESELWRQVEAFSRELKRQREALADIPEHAWKRLAQNYIDKEGTRHTYWSSMLTLREEADALHEQIQRQFTPLVNAGLLNRDLADEELADLLVERTDDPFDQIDKELFEQLNFYLTDEPQ